jgi:DNA repair exonuclease SbcCD ATPase subunit
MRIESVEWKNFNSYGNVPQRIDLGNGGDLYLLLGGNGNGKSTISEVITFSLYGKLENKKKGDLPNRINKNLWCRIVVISKGKKITIKSKTMNPLHEHNVDRLEDLEDEMIGSGIKSGAFTKQCNDYNKKHHQNLSLHEFALLVLHNKGFKEITKKRARFYLNLNNNLHGSGNQISEMIDNISGRNRIRPERIPEENQQQRARRARVLPLDDEVSSVVLRSPENIERDYEPLNTTDAHILHWLNNKRHGREFRKEYNRDRQEMIKRVQRKIRSSRRRIDRDNVWWAINQIDQELDERVAREMQR